MITDITNEAQLQDVIHSTNAILFKHSTSCSLSDLAYREVRSFSESHPEIPVFVISVIERRAFSDRLAELFQVKHASPQILIIRDEHAVLNFSHQRITKSTIENSIGVPA